MPRTQINYSNTIIYKIVCKDLNVKDLYVGHTTDFIRRKNNHKKNCTNKECRDYSYKVYEMIRNNGGWENWDMIELEKFSCNDGNEARARERHYYDLLSPALNSIVPNRNMNEWIHTNKENVRLQRKKHYDENKEAILKKDKLYKTKNYDKIKARKSEKILCDCGREICRATKARHLRSHIHSIELQI